MIFEEYRKNVENLLSEFPGNKNLATNAFKLLFSVIESLATRLDKIDKHYDILNYKISETIEKNETKETLTTAWAILSDIQYIICFTPLRYFLHELTKSSFLWIRSCAKRELCDKTGEYFNDPEINLVSIANLHMILSKKLPSSSLTEEEIHKFEKSFDLSKRAGLLWQILKIIDLNQN